jgi:hypothetical protein
VLPFPHACPRWRVRGRRHLGLYFVVEDADGGFVELGREHGSTALDERRAAGSSDLPAVGEQVPTCAAGGHLLVTADRRLPLPR